MGFPDRTVMDPPVKPVPVQMIEIVIEGRPPSANARPGNVHARARETAQWRKDAGSLARVARRAWETKHGQLWRPLPAAALSVTFFIGDQRRHDFDNLVTTIKPLMDGIVDAGILEDDSIEVIQYFDISAERRPKVTMTRFTISEIDPDG